MTKQSSKYKSAPFGAALLTGLPRYARNDRGAVKRNRAARAGCGKDAVRRRHVFNFCISELYHCITN